MEANGQGTLPVGKSLEELGLNERAQVNTSRHSQQSPRHSQQFVITSQPRSDEEAFKPIVWQVRQAFKSPARSRAESNESHGKRSPIRDSREPSKTSTNERRCRTLPASLSRQTSSSPPSSARSQRSGHFEKPGPDILRQSWQAAEIVERLHRPLYAIRFKAAPVCRSRQTSNSPAPHSRAEENALGMMPRTCLPVSDRSARPPPCCRSARRSIQDVTLSGMSARPASASQGARHAMRDSRGPERGESDFATRTIVWRSPRAPMQEFATNAAPTWQANGICKATQPMPACIHHPSTVIGTAFADDKERSTLPENSFQRSLQRICDIAPSDPDLGSLRFAVPDRLFVPSSQLGLGAGQVVSTPRATAQGVRQTSPLRAKWCPAPVGKVFPIRSQSPVALPSAMPSASPPRVRCPTSLAPGPKSSYAARLSRPSLSTACLHAEVEGGVRR